MTQRNSHRWSVGFNRQKSSAGLSIAQPERCRPAPRRTLFVRVHGLALAARVVALAACLRVFAAFSARLGRLGLGFGSHCQRTGVGLLPLRVDSEKCPKSCRKILIPACPPKHKHRAAAPGRPAGQAASRHGNCTLTRVLASLVVCSRRRADLGLHRGWRTGHDGYRTAEYSA